MKMDNNKAMMINENIKSLPSRPLFTAFSTTIFPMYVITSELRDTFILLNNKNSIALNTQIWIHFGYLANNHYKLTQQQQKTVRNTQYIIAFMFANKFSHTYKIYFYIDFFSSVSYYVVRRILCLLFVHDHMHMVKITVHLLHIMRQFWFGVSYTILI